MFQLRKEQVEALRALDDREFQRRALDHIRSRLPSHCTAEFTPDLLREILSSSAQAARDFGLTNEYGVICYFDAVLLTGLEAVALAEQEEIQVLLADDERDADDKAEALLRLAVDLYTQKHGDLERIDAEEFRD